MNSTAALIPVVLMIACGWLAAKLGWIREEYLPGLVNVVFLILTPALLFRTMSHMGFSEFNYAPMLAYFGVALAFFSGVSIYLGGSQRAVVIGLACVFSNLVMIGIPLVNMAYGAQGLVTLITLISIHALTLLSFATLLLEWQRAKEDVQGGASSSGSRYRQLPKIVGKAAYRAVVHPVIFPIIVGLMWNLTGWTIPTLVDQTLITLGQANAPMSLLLVGAALAHTRIQGELRGAMMICLVKNMAMPAAVFTVGWLLGIRGIPLAVITVAAGLPVGNNVYLFSHRYGQAQSLVTAAMTMSTALSMLTLALLMGLVAYGVPLL